MKIYTRTGDKGQTSLSSGERVVKSHPRVEAYGTVDELNSHIGLLRNWLSSNSVFLAEIDPTLTWIQNELFEIGTQLSKSQPSPLQLDKLTQHLESEMDRMTAALPPLKNFVLPGGSKLASQAHICRTVCRRAERLAVSLSNPANSTPDPAVLLLNRLSDYFFVLSRYFNLKEGVQEVLWRPH